MKPFKSAAGNLSGIIDTTAAQPARMYDYYLGGKDNYPVDVEAAERVLAMNPSVRTTAKANRAWMERVVFELVTLGVDQFLDVGTGIPTSPNTHQIAQGICPSARVVYVDNDPIVMAHARALMTSTPAGRTEYILADLRDPASILEAPELREVLDLERPVALLLVAVMHFVEDRSGPYDIVRTLMAALPPGSYLALTHVTGDFEPQVWEQIVQVYRQAGAEAQVRTFDETCRFFDDLDLVEPGLQLVTQWRPPPGPDVARTPAAVACYGGLAVKPSGPAAP